MTSKRHSFEEAYIWLWLPGECEPVVAGRLFNQGGTLSFNYGKTYLARENAISIFDVELPLEPSLLQPKRGLSIPGCIRDAAPDAWGRRVIINSLLGGKGPDADLAQLDELTYLLESGSDRIGALDFQISPREYVARVASNASLEELQSAADRVERGIPLTKELDLALRHGSSIGGARPKALVDGQGKKYIAKFSSSTDLFNVVKAEFIAMRLANYAGLEVASVELKRVLQRDVLLIQRFDRELSANGYTRKNLISALTLLGLDEMMARYASYEDLAEIVRFRFSNAAKCLRELFGRLVFNILCGNTDDHARNHAAFWDGQHLALTPAYDICPQNRVGHESSQGMLIHAQQRASKLIHCVEVAHKFLLTEEEARKMIRAQVEAIETGWSETCDLADLSQVDRSFLWKRQFLNEYAFIGL